MARIRKALTELDAEIAGQLAVMVEDSGMGRRRLSEITGMSTNRLGIILRREPPPATVGEIGAIAEAFGRTASEVIASAEGTFGRSARVIHLNRGAMSDPDETLPASSEAIAAHEDSSVQDEFEAMEQGE